MKAIRLITGLSLAALGNAIDILVEFGTLGEFDLTGPRRPPSC